MRAFAERRRAGNGTRRHFIFVASDAVNTMDMKRYGSITVNSLFVEVRPRNVTRHTIGDPVNGVT